MVVERYDQADLSDLVPTLGLKMEPELCHSTGCSRTTCSSVMSIWTWVSAAVTLLGSGDTGDTSSK